MPGPKLTGIRWLLVGWLVVQLFSLSVTAQDSNPPVFATNTPIPPTPTTSLPATSLEHYALRLWQERDLVDLLIEQVQALSPDDDEAQLAIRMTQFELARRFPDAPHQLAQRERLVTTMLNAPRGSVDMRGIVQPYIEFLLNNGGNAAQPYPDYKGFSITILPANIDNRGLMDAVVHTVYPENATDPAKVLYSDYVLALAGSDGRYNLLESALPFPAAPLDDVSALTLEQIRDLNADGTDEMILRLHDADPLNDELMIFGWRGDQAASLIQPGVEIHYAQIDWDNNTFTNYRIESPEWGCIGELEVRWVWSRNFFRLTSTANSYIYQSSQACRLYQSEPLFDQSPRDAIATIQSILTMAQSPDDLSNNRAQLMLAMLEALDGRTSEALERAQSLQTTLESDTPSAQEVVAFIDRLSTPGVTPLQVCGVLVAGTLMACDVDAVLKHIFSENPLRRDTPINEQLADMGIVVLDNFIISQVGRFDRQGVHFNLGGDRWWAFAQLDEEFFTAEQIEPPASAVPTPAPPVLITIPPGAYRAFFEASDLPAMLNVLDTTLTNRQGIPVAVSLRYMQTLGYDLVGDRDKARRGYFDLWASEPATIWGQLAAEHLEQR